MASPFINMSHLRRGLEAAAAAEVARHGVDGVRRSALVKLVAGQGVSRRTAYRWVAAALDAERAPAPPDADQLAGDRFQAAVEAALVSQAPALAASVVAHLRHFTALPETPA